MIRNLALVGALGLFWGLNWPAVRVCLHEMDPWTLRTVGFWVAAIFMFALLRALGQPLAVPRRHWGRLVAVALLTTAAYNLLSAFAQLTASTTRSAVLSYTMPIWAVIFARIVLKEPFDGRRITGLLFGAAGLAALGWPLLVSGDLSWGLLFALLSGVVWAAGSVVLKRYPIDAPPIVIAAWQLPVGGIVAGIGLVLFEKLPGGLPVETTTWIAFAYHIVFAQVAANALWFTILSRMPAGIASIGTLLVPGVGVIGAAVLLGEHPTVADWIGLALIVAASASVLLGFPQRARPAVAATIR